MNTGLKRPVDPIKMLKGIIRQKEKPILSEAEKLKELELVKREVYGQDNN